MLLGKEPTAILYSIQGVLQAVNVVAMPWNGTVNQAAHAAIAVVLAGIGALVNRAVVTPST